MAKSAKGFDARLAAVRAGEPKAVATALAGDSGILIAAAIPHALAAAVTSPAMTALFGALAAAFDRLCEDGSARDPTCRGKLAIARALAEADQWDEIFVRGLRVVQREGQEDTAAALRALCALAHVRMFRPDALDVCAELLADSWRNARLGAAEALGQSSSYASPVLRLKLRIGDSEPEVLAACADSLLGVAREASIPFLIGLLRGEAERASVAAIALGAARVTEAFEALRAYCTAAPPEPRRRAGYVALALLRSDEATAELCRIVREAHRADAIAAAKALATFEENRAAAREAAGVHPDPAVRTEVARLTDDIG